MNRILTFRRAAGPTAGCGSDVARQDGVATADLSSEFESGGGSMSVFVRLGQVVYTLTQFPTIQSVVFEIEGRPATVFSGEGIVLDGPVGRDDYEDLLPAIFVDRPAYGAGLGNPARITGSANVFEQLSFRRKRGRNAGGDCSDGSRDARLGVKAGSTERLRLTAR